MLTNKFEKVIKSRLEEEKPLLQILLGPRQVGKTTTAERIFDNWPGPKIMVTADSPTPPSTEWIRWNWEQALRKGEDCLLIIDEVQKVPNWSEQIKLLFDDKQSRQQLKVLLLGSSSLYLQKGLSESLAGRFELTPANHWSYREFNEEFGWDFDTYLRFGAYPGAAAFKNDKGRWRNYILNSIIEPVLSRDVLALQPVNKPALFRQTFELAAQYPAQIVSLQKMLGQLQDKGNAATIKHYLELLQKCFLVRCLEKYSGSAIQTKSSSPKIVVLNPAIIHAYQDQDRLDSDPSWYGFVFESVIGAHLAMIPNSELYYWREGRFEVDYILKTPKGIMAIEVKSGTRKVASGLERFSKIYPSVSCELWDKKRCLQFLTAGMADLTP